MIAKIIEGEDILLTLELDEYRCMTNILNEVINGFRVTDFTRQIGISLEDAQRLLGRVQEVYKTSSASFRLKRGELRAIRNALDATRSELGDWEFPIRVGLSVGEAAEIARSMDSILGS